MNSRWQAIDALELLAWPDHPAAIFAGMDHQALCTYRAAAELGWRIPADVSVLRFDNLPFADWVTPRLPTIGTPLADMTPRAARMVLRRLSGEQPETTRREVATELVVRESSGLFDRGEAGTRSTFVPSPLKPRRAK